MLEKIEILLWFCATSFGSICVGILIAGYILAFVKKSQPDWIKVILLSAVILCPCGWLIYSGIQHNDWNILVAAVWLVMVAAASYIGIKAQYEASSDTGEGEESPEV